MRYGLSVKCAVAAALAAMAVGPAALLSREALGAEIHLLARCTECGPLVTLGDIAQITAADPAQAESLGGIDLFPAPSAGRSRFVRLREIQDLLILRGVNLLGHRFSGASQVEITAPTVTQRPAAEQKPLSAPKAERAQRRLREAIVAYLKKHASASSFWQVRIEPDPEQTRLLSNADQISIAGGSPPWTGNQTFEVTVQSDQGSTLLKLNAKVTLPQAVVVTTHALARDATILASDVRLTTDIPGDQQAGAFCSIDQVVGQQTISTIPDGNIVRQDMVRPPLLVRRGDVITVYARSAGIKVRTNARAKEDGGLGDLIGVESMSDRKTYLARVSGIQEVEVYARAMRASHVPSSTSARSADGRERK